MKIASIMAVAITTTLLASAAGTPAKAFKDGIGSVASIHPEPVMPRANGPYPILSGRRGLKGIVGPSDLYARSGTRSYPGFLGRTGVRSYKGFKGFKGFGR